MALFIEKKSIIRTQIIGAAAVYKEKLAGKVFLYVSGNHYFEVAFPTDRFLHLTGVNSCLAAQRFYDKASDSTLSMSQFFFDKDHSYRNAKRKSLCLSQLPSLTDSLVCVLQNLSTASITYKLGVTNLSFTLGLAEHTDLTGRKISDWFLPRTLRVNDKAIENSSDAAFVDFIFSKSAVDKKYGNIMYMDNGKSISSEIASLLVDNFQDLHKIWSISHGQRMQK